jgi:hypothetical protein
MAGAPPVWSSTHVNGIVVESIGGAVRCRRECELSGQVPGNDGRPDGQRKPGPAAPEEARSDEEHDRQCEQGEQADARTVHIECEIPVCLLEDREARRVVRDVLSHLVRSRQQQVEHERRR